MPIIKVQPKQKIVLSDIDADNTGNLSSKKEARKLLAANIKRIAALQNLLYAESKHAVLIVLQAMDAGGKDGTIRRVMSGINPQGVRVSSFKAPSAEERSHDFLWRVHHHVPPKGIIGVFNRSHYEDVLVVRVHNLAPKSIWEKRYAAINNFEHLLATDNQITILKFYLHISKAEQTIRFKERLSDPNKRWKFNAEDLEKQKHWDEYMAAFETVFEKCSTPYAPWYIVPANKKWYRNLVISETIIKTLENLNMQYPPEAEGWEAMQQQLETST